MYGWLACAPYLSLRVFQQLLEDEGSHYPLAVPHLKKDRYVDDIFGGADFVEQLEETINHLKKVCMAGSFKLKNGQVTVLQRSRLFCSYFYQRKLNSYTLGLCWKLVTDVFQFMLNPSSVETIKRTILSNIAKLFDPLGFLFVCGAR